MPKIQNWSASDKSEIPQILGVNKKTVRDVWKHDNSTTFVVVNDQRAIGVTQGDRYGAVVFTHRNGKNSSRIITSTDNLELAKKRARKYMSMSPNASLKNAGRFR